MFIRISELSKCWPFCNIYNSTKCVCVCVCIGRQKHSSEKQFFLYDFALFIYNLFFIFIDHWDWIHFLWRFIAAIFLCPLQNDDNFYLIISFPFFFKALARDFDNYSTWIFTKIDRVFIFYFVWRTTCRFLFGSNLTFCSFSFFLVDFTYHFNAPSEIMCKTNIFGCQLRFVANQWFISQSIKEIFQFVI